MNPETRYAKRGEAHVAYQVVGDGPIDFLLTDAWFSQVEIRWELPAWARLLNRLAKIGRVIIFDRLGTGLSDPVPLTALPTLEEWMDDVRAVLDAAASDRAVLIGAFDAGPMAILFAATHPDRTKALVLANTYARFARAPDYHHGAPLEALKHGLDFIVRKWGTAELFAAIAPSIAEDEEARRWFGRLCRQSASPGVLGAMVKVIQAIDVRAVLSTIRVPTLVLHRSNAQWIRIGHGRYLAEHIQQARLIELPGRDSAIMSGDQDALLAEIELFTTGKRPEHETDRVLSTVLFTDIVGSTDRIAREGDRAWQELLSRHYAVVRRELARHRGREVDTAGDGLFATFDGPARAIRFAMALRKEVRALGLELRTGLHTGECELTGNKVSGIAVHIGSRIQAKSDPGEVLVSSTVKDLVSGSGIEFIDRGGHVLKGVPDEWHLFAVKPVD